jgi:hypothetical protein
VPEECRGWARTCVWRLSDCKNVSLCSEITRRGPVEGVFCGTLLSIDTRRVFGEWLVVFKCSVLSFWNGNKLQSWIEPAVRYSMAAFVENLLNDLLVFISHFLGLWLQFRWPQWLLVWQSISYSTSAECLYLDFFTFIIIIVISNSTSSIGSLLINNLIYLLLHFRKLKRLCHLYTVHNGIIE